ncbi:MAG: hypothetical protein NUV55_08650 [Sulfuricaulis sp.]|uniref:hypothetical protein n=1 Tax=Sulfuricaulis sp. TaxID=2003553 RepID=UPI0025FB386C|nr:hypothetical protein [Sulfuricaulis sp.]MCR4347251.1 hypothetical protein [Sulfuricaulis sp.]
MEVLMIPKNFQEWVCSLSGCDGGNIEADTWLCGIEWGGGSYEDGIYYEKHLPEEISKGKFTPEQNLFKWKDSITYPYGRSFAKLYAAMQGESGEDYRDLALNKWDGSELFKLNLYPIAFDSTNESLWQKYKLKEITGFDEKHLFQTWCFMNRFPALSRLREEKAPKLIICTGVSYLREFFMCFGGGQSTSGLIKYEDITPTSENNRQYKRRYYWVNIDEQTKLVVIPFFSGPSGLNSNYLLKLMGNKIREICT